MPVELVTNCLAPGFRFTRPSSPDSLPSLLPFSMSRRTPTAVSLPCQGTSCCPTSSWPLPGSQLTQEMLQLDFKITADPWHRSRVSPYVRCCGPQGRGDGFGRRWGRREGIAQPQQHLVSARMCGRWRKGGTRPSICLSARRASWYLALAVQHCQPESPGMKQGAPLCQSPRGMGAARLLPKSSATGGITVCLGNGGLMELSAPPSPQHRASAAA